MTLDIVPVALEQEDLFARWHATYVAANVHDVGRHHTCWTLPELRVAMEPGRRRAEQAWAGLEGGEVVVAGHLATPLLDNLDSAAVEVSTLPSARRRGHGSAVLEVLEQEAQRLGRTRLDAETGFPYDAGSAGSGVPGVAFARRHGYTLGLSDVQRELRLPVDVGLLDRLAEEAAAHHAAYTLRSFVGRVPDDVVESRLALSNTLMTEAPTGEMELEPEAVDVSVFRESEGQLARQGRVPYRTVALAPDGSVAAYSDLVTTVHEPGRAYQWGTLVRRQDRGHRLGLAVKAANHRQLQDARPDLDRVTTFNAEVNEHMIGVNERLGFEPVARLAELQKRLS